ncbi:prolyl oligopeptidase family serine peptidase [Flavobacterium sp. NRK F7]|uniref:prolyl oligopeptidase family serine peptidase n=1 Tax=Flavobacterium sp. NRK F7 TaxID=2954930 RepID=UPI002091E567|nr:prolyl oligopeptidase family serine peptidase [Flavobacterium sp. NRK F7]MCO6161877.1 prolyl oligopeptidase family serine peptidase [Flavobacterium sp. NRK F7]
MQKKACFLVCYFILLNIYCQKNPTTKKVTSSFTMHEITISDDYAWLENTSSDDVSNWVAEQNAYSRKHLDDVVKATNFLFKIKDYRSLSTNSLPVKKGRYFYINFRLDKNKPSVLHYQKNLNEMPLELVNPYKIYKDENVLLNGYYPSKNSKYLAYKISPDGSDRHEIRFVDIISQNPLDDVLKDIKFSNVSWKGDQGIFYKKNSNQNFFAKDSTYQLYYHTLRDIQEKDKLIFDTTKEESNFNFFVSENKLFIEETNKEETAKNYYYVNLEDEEFTLTKFIDNASSDFTILKYKNNKVYFTDNKYDWGDIRFFDLNNKNEKVSVIPQIYSHLLIDSYFLENYIVCKYRNLGRNYITIYNYDGSFVRKFEAPMEMDFSFRFYDNKTNELYVTFYSYTISYLNYKLNITTGDTNIYYDAFIRPKPTLFPFDYFEIKTINYRSRDNKDVPITIVHKKGIELNGNNPTLLEAYGGFGVINNPKYDVGLLHFLEKGGIYAFAQIRGGGEKGRKWHRDGKGVNKPNTFNDFIDAAEFLISEKYTCPNKLAISGASHGGLVVGAALTMRPDLFKVVIPIAGRLDLSTLDKYTTGIHHFDEYGNPNNKNEFELLMSYSPYEKIKEVVNYPTCLIITSENDDRVPPFQSYKFAAKLQNREAQKNPIYLLINDKAGHYGKVSNYKNYVEKEAEFYSFIWEHLNE